MPDHFKRLLVVILTALFVLLPVFFLLLRKGKRTRTKLFFSIASVLLFLLNCTAIVMFLMIQYGSLELEWRGGYVPMPTWKKTKTDMDAVIRSRAEQAKLPTPAAEPAHSGAEW